MHIHRISGRTLKDALRRARQELGEDAVVLSQEHTSTGVTIALADRQMAAQRKRRHARRDTRRRIQRASVAAVVAPPRTESGEERGDLADARRRLVRAGCSRAFVEEVLKRAARRDQHAIDSVATILGSLFPVAPGPRRRGRRHVLAFVGPTGVGKTTTLAKLGLRLARAGRRVAFATMDTFRAGAADQLQAYADMIEVPMLVAKRGAQLARSVLSQGDSDLVLLDTTGRSPRDAKQLAILGRELAATGDEVALDTFLVQAASSGPEAIDAAAAAYGITRPSAQILTKLDETPRPGVALERCLLLRSQHGQQRSRLGFAFLCDGQEVVRNLHRAVPDHFADLLLRGRLS